MSDQESERRLLICGEYSALQETRADVLRLAGFPVETVFELRDIPERLRQRRYGLLLLCQSLGEERIESLRATAEQAGVAIYPVRPLIPAEALIEDVQARVGMPPDQT